MKDKRKTRAHSTGRANRAAKTRQKCVQESARRANKAAGAKIRTKPAGGEACGPGTKPQNAGAPAGSPAHSRRAAAAQAKQQRQTAAGREQGSDTPAEKTPEHRSQTPPQQRPAAQERPARHMARRAGRRKTPPNRQNTRSLFCLPGGPCEPGPPKIRFAVFDWHGLFLLRIAHNAAQSAE